MKKELAAVNARFKELTPWLTDEERDKVYIKYVLYIVRNFPHKKTRVFAHDKTEFTSAEYCEFKKQIFPDGIIKHFDYFDKWLGHGALIQSIKDYSAAHQDVTKGEHQSYSQPDKPEKRIEIGDLVKTTDGSVLKVIGSLDLVRNTVLAECLQPTNVRYTFGDRLYICIEKVTKLSKFVPDTPKGFPVGTYVTQIKEGKSGVYRIAEEPDECGCQHAERIVPRRYERKDRAINAALEPAYLSPDIFRVITPEEMNDKLINFIKFLKGGK